MKAFTYDKLWRGHPLLNANVLQTTWESLNALNIAIGKANSKVMGYEKKVHPCSCILNKPAHLNEMTVETASWAFAALASPHLRWFSHSKHVFFLSATNRLVLYTMCKLISIFYNPRPSQKTNPWLFWFLNVFSITCFGLRPDHMVFYKWLTEK